MENGEWRMEDGGWSVFFGAGDSDISSACALASQIADRSAQRGAYRISGQEPLSLCGPMLYAKAPQ